MKKTLYILGGLVSAFSLSTAFPMSPCAFNRYVAVSDSCMYSRIAIFIFGLVGILSAIALLVKSRTASGVASAPIASSAPDAGNRRGPKTFIMLLIIAIAFQIAIIYRSFTATPPIVCGTDCGDIDTNATSTASATATTTAPAATSSPATDQSNEKTVTLKLNEVARFGNQTVRVAAVTEDSRCPSDVQCVWAGRVKVLITLGRGVGADDVPSGEMEPGQTKTVGDMRITLMSVSPHPVSTRKIADGEYRFTLRLTRN